MGSFADSQAITVSDDSSVVRLFFNRRHLDSFVDGLRESISQRLAVESTNEQIIGEVEAVRGRAQGPELIREIGVREATIYIWKSKTAA